MVMNQFFNIECQFLIGKVQRTITITTTDGNSYTVKCQFLIGKVQRNRNYFLKGKRKSCQFLIGKVQQSIIGFDRNKTKIVSIPHR